MFYVHDSVTDIQQIARKYHKKKLNYQPLISLTANDCLYHSKIQLCGNHFFFFKIYINKYDFVSEAKLLS